MLKNQGVKPEDLLKKQRFDSIEFFLLINKIY